MIEKEMTLITDTPRPTPANKTTSPREPMKIIVIVVISYVRKHEKILGMAIWVNFLPMSTVDISSHSYSCPFAGSVLYGLRKGLFSVSLSNPSVSKEKLFVSSQQRPLSLSSV